MFKKATYTLFEASELLQQPIGYFLKLAADSAVPLYVRVPVGRWVVNVGPSDIMPRSKPDERAGRPSPVRSGEVDFVQLWPKDCLLLLNAGISTARTFPTGGALHVDGHLRCVEPLVPTHYTGSFATYKGLDRLIRYFATYRPSVALDDWEAIMQPTPVEVEPQDVLITREALSALHVSSKVACFESMRQAALEQAHTTPLMRNLCELHSELCSSAYLHGLKFPAQKAIEIRLQEDFSFSGNLAKCGAWVLSRTSMDVDKVTGRQVIRAPRLEALIKCADEYWSTSPERPFPNPSSADIVEALGAYGFSVSRGEAANSIIRPQTAQKGRKRKLATV